MSHKNDAGFIWVNTINVILSLAISLLGNRFFVAFLYCFLNFITRSVCNMCFQHFLIITTSILLEFVCWLVWYCCFMFLPEAYINTRVYFAEEQRTSSCTTNEHVILPRLS